MSKLLSAVHTINRMDLQQIKHALGDAQDLVVKEINRFKKTVTIVFLETLVDSATLNNTVVKALYETKETQINNSNVNNVINHLKLEKSSEQEQVIPLLLNGFALLFIEESKDYYKFETRATLNSPIGEAKTEKMIKGPRDAFCENYQTNIGMIRRRIKDPQLRFEEIEVGRRSKSKVSLFYIADIAYQKRVDELKKRIEKIDIDFVVSSNSLLEMISPSNQPSIPSYIASERPDTTCEALLQGKIVIMLENSPVVSIVPAVITDFLKVPDDWYELGINSWLTRLIRFSALLITLLIIPLYIAFINFNFEVIPVELLMSITKQKDGLPFPNIVEVLMLLLLFEILRETDQRMSSSMGSSLSIVGALIIGDAAVRAGLVSSIGVIVAALASISGLVFNRIEIVNGIRWYRLFLIFMSAVLGLFGLVIGIVIAYFNLSKVSFFEVPLLPSSDAMFGNKTTSINVGFKRWLFSRSPMNSKNKKRGHDD